MGFPLGPSRYMTDSYEVDHCTPERTRGPALKAKCISGACVTLQGDSCSSTHFCRYWHVVVLFHGNESLSSGETPHKLRRDLAGPQDVPLSGYAMHAPGSRPSKVLSREATRHRPARKEVATSSLPKDAGA